MASNLNLLQKIELFDKFVQHWQQAVGGDVIVVSTEGNVVANSNGVFPTDVHRILEQASPYQPGVINYLDQTLLAAPINLGRENLGYVLALNGREQDVSLLAWLAETIGKSLEDAVALRDMTDELIGAWDQLELIYRVTSNLTLTEDLIAVLRSVVREIQKVVNTEDGFILLKRFERLEFVAATNSLSRDFVREDLLNYLGETDRVVLCNDALACREIWPDAPAYVETMLAIQLPILEEGVKAGLCLINNKSDKSFSAGDVKLIAALGQQVGTIITNFIVHEKLLIEGRLSRELEIAAEIQESLLPTTLPHVGGLSIAVSSKPASEVGGDFYDFITVDDRKLTLVMGDVAGKGIPAAMLTSVTRTMLRVEAMRGEPPLNIIQQANNVLHEDLSRADSFVTVFVATIDTVEGTLDYASAGHTPALLWRSATRTAEQLRATSPPIGLYGYQIDSPHPLRLYPGDTLVLYTDGITEAQSPGGDFFGFNRLTYILETRGNEPPEMLQHCIQTEVSSFRRDSRSRDDATLLIVKMLPQSDASPLKNISTIIKTIEFSYPADINCLTEISEMATTVCRELPALPSGFGANDFIYHIELAISEICTNIIKHAYAGMVGKLDGRITLLNNGIQLDFYDTGISFDPNTVPQPNIDPSHLEEGGYGLHIVRQIMDVVSYKSHPQHGNHWYLLKLLPPTS